MIRHFKLLAIEGIDGAGKGTQLELLSRVLAERGLPYTRISFPQYNSFFGQMVARFLNGEFGALEAVDPHFSALLYAGDRLEARAELLEALEQGKTVLADRYIASNLAHQTARVPPERREEFLEWLMRLEYGVFRLPREELVVYLRVPASVAQELVSRKAARDYTRHSRDLQEASLAHLEQAAQVYDRLAQGANWVTVECFDAARGAMLPAEEIHRVLLAEVERRAGFLVKRQRQRKFRPHDPPRM